MTNYDAITYKINGCAMKVHTTLGNGFQEVIYQRFLAIELQRAGLEFSREISQDIFSEIFTLARGEQILLSSRM